MTEVEKKILEAQPYQKEGLVVTKVRINSCFTFGKKLERKPQIDCELEIEGRKRPKKTSILYGFCPFCGNKLNEQENEPKNEALPVGKNN